MKTSSKGLQLIEKYEGLILQSYDDANDHIVKSGDAVHGTLTIGYGHTNAAGSPTVHPGQVITKLQAEDILASDLQKVEADVARLVKVPVNQNQFDALVSFHFNTGSLGKSSALVALNKGDYKSAAEKLTLYNRGRVNGGLVPMAGLTRRRTEEKALFLTPVTSAGQVVAPVGTVVLGGSALSVTPINYWPYIIAGTILAAFVAYIAFSIYEYRKSNV